LQYDWISRRAHAFIEEDQMYSYRCLFARLLYNEEHDRLYLLSVPRFTGKVFWNEEKRHSRIEPVVPKSEYYASQGLRPFQFNLPGMDFEPGSIIQYHMFLDVDKMRWCPAYKSCQLVK
jgi:hypothetical protein